MTMAIDVGERAPIALGALAEALEEMRFDPADADNFVAAAPLLAGLARDRGFFGSLLIAELGSRARSQERDSGYGPQVVMLHTGADWFVRANIWPAASDSLLRANGPARFFYGVPHDHNFHFLTIGYSGPGYVSDYYDYDHEALDGVSGETAGLRFIERSNLAEGRMLLYRAHRDVHSQRPPDVTSVSLNIVQGGNGRAFTNQYLFDIERDRITGQLAHSSAEALLALLPALGGAEGADLLEQFARHHPCDRMRYGAIAARAGAAPDLDARIAVLARGAADGNRTVAALARHELAELEAGRGWIEG